MITPIINIYDNVEPKQVDQSSTGWLLREVTIKKPKEEPRSNTVRTEVILCKLA